MPATFTTVTYTPADIRALIRADIARTKGYGWDDHVHYTGLPEGNIIVEVVAAAPAEPLSDIPNSPWTPSLREMFPEPTPDMRARFREFWDPPAEMSPPPAIVGAPVEIEVEDDIIIDIEDLDGPPVV